MDDMLFPAFSTARIRSKNVTFDESRVELFDPPKKDIALLTVILVGDAMVRELEFSAITLRLREHGDDGEDAVLAKLSGSTLETLKMCLVLPSSYSFSTKKKTDSCDV